MTVSNNDVLRLSTVWTVGGSDEQVNVWHVGVTTIPGSVADLNDDLAEYLTDLYSDVLTAMVNDLVHTRIEVFNVTDGSPEVWIGAVPALDGQDSGDPLPLGAAMLVYWRTSISRVIGKKYLPTMSEANHTGGVWNAGTILAGDDMGLKFMNPYVSANGTTIRGQVYRPTTNTTTLPITYTTSPIVAYQRRRRPGRGS